jgi:hypothetical protein
VIDANGERLFRCCGVTSRVRFCETAEVSTLITDRKAQASPALAVLSKMIGRVVANA